MSKFFRFSKLNCQKTAAPKAQHWYNRISLNYFVLNIAFVAIIIALFVSYIGLVNDTSADGFALDQLQDQLAAVSSQNKQLDLHVQSLQSMDNIKQVSENFTLEPVTDAEYLSGKPSVALSE
ncbi:MAG: hypothetical protein WC752_03570 [Patescibacteria group bacterium]|jgi:hypothetical protein